MNWQAVPRVLLPLDQEGDSRAQGQLCKKEEGEDIDELMWTIKRNDLFLLVAFFLGDSIYELKFSWFQGTAGFCEKGGEANSRSFTSRWIAVEVEQPVWWHRQ